MSNHQNEYTPTSPHHRTAAAQWWLALCSLDILAVRIHRWLAVDTHRTPVLARGEAVRGPQSDTNTRRHTPRQGGTLKHDSGAWLQAQVDGSSCLRECWLGLLTTFHSTPSWITSEGAKTCVLMSLQCGEWSWIFLKTSTESVTVNENLPKQGVDIRVCDICGFSTARNKLVWSWPRTELFQWGESRAESWSQRKLGWHDAQVGAGIGDPGVRTQGEVEGKQLRCIRDNWVLPSLDGRCGILSESLSEKETAGVVGDDFFVSTVASKERADTSGWAPAESPCHRT